MRRILIGYDGSPRGDDAFALGRNLAQLLGDPVLLVATVYEQLSPKSPPDDERPAQRRERIAAEETLAAARARWPEIDAAACHAVCANSPAEGLQRLAAEQEADVIVVGSSHRRGLGRVWPGSATERTLHQSPCAVAVAPPGYADRVEDARIERIGVAYTSSDESRRALDHAAALARATGATVVVITVVDTVGPPITGAYGVGSFVEILRDTADQQLAGAKARLERLGIERIELERPEGPPIHMLQQASTRLDLLLLGSRSHGALGRLMLGTVSAGVVRDAACPVLVHPRSAVPAADSERPHDPSVTPPGGTADSGR